MFFIFFQKLYLRNILRSYLRKIRAHACTFHRGLFLIHCIYNVLCCTMMCQSKETYLFTFEHRYIKKVLLFISFIKFVKLCKNSIFGTCTCKSYLFVSQCVVEKQQKTSNEFIFYIKFFIKEKSSSYLKSKYYFYTVTTTDGKNVVI